MLPSTTGQDGTENRHDPLDPASFWANLEIIEPRTRQSGFFVAAISTYNDDRILNNNKTSGGQQ
jgi:hypothetical protein